MWLKSTIVRTNEQNKRTITRGQGRNREVGSEGRLWETCELMDKNYIKGRRIEMSWLHTAKSFSSHTEVNVAVVQGSTVFLPGEASGGSAGRFKSTTKTIASVTAMLQVLPSEESAEGIVVLSEPVSSLRPMGVRRRVRHEKSKARTKEEEATGGVL